jgi:hypothetical protein
MNSSMNTNGKRDMDTEYVRNTIRKKISMIDDAKKSVQLTEKRTFYKIYGYGLQDDLRIYMENRKESILRGTFMKKMTIVRSLYLVCLRHMFIQTRQTRLWDAIYNRGVTLKADIFKGLDENSNYVSDKDRRYIKMVISTIEKYKKEYLEKKTSISVEILRAIRCKYIDKVIMGFL